MLAANRQRGAAQRMRDRSALSLADLDELGPADGEDEAFREGVFIPTAVDRGGSESLPKARVALACNVEDGAGADDLVSHPLTIVRGDGEE
jgi:hypothetical protein